MRIAIALCAAVVTFTSVCASAQAADRHDYRFQFDEVPATGPHGETVQLPGPIVAPNAMTVDSGEVYLADDIYHEAGRAISRMDRFNAASGAFLGQLDWPEGSASYSADGIAVGHAGGETQVYVSAYEEHSGEYYPPVVLAVFNPAGTLEKIWRGTQAASGGFGCCSSSDVAVDDSAGLLGDWAAGDVYVADAANNVVDVYEPETGAGEGKPVAELKGISPSEPFTGPYEVAVSPVSGDVTVADGTGVHVLRPGVIPGQYEPLATLTRPDGQSFGDVAIDANDGEGDVYVLSQNEEKIFEFNAAGEYQGQVTPESAPVGWWGSEVAHPAAIATDPATHDLYVGTYNNNNPASVFVFGANIVFPDVATAAASKLMPTTVTLNGTVNLDKGGPATCQFEWGPTSALGELAPCPGKVQAEGRVAVSADVGGLRPGSTYYYRLQATNANGTNDESQLQQFTTLGPHEIEASASNVAATSATLNTTIDPDGDPTSYYFQYGQSGEYETEVPLAPGAPLGSGSGEATVSRHIQGLTPGVVYHYRVTMVSEVEVEPNVVERFEFPGNDQTFTTQVAGTGLVLPDSRQWEMVSPPNKHGSSISGITEGIDQAASSGEAITYFGTLPIESEAVGDSVAVETQILSTRGATGWSSTDVALPHATPTGPSLGQGREYKMFSEDLSLGLVQPFGEYTSLGGEAMPPDTERTPYLRHDLTCHAQPKGCYEPLVTGAPGYADVPAGTVFNGPEHESFGSVSVRGGTSDLAHVVLVSAVPLTAEGGNLYEWSAGNPPSKELQSIALLPEDEGGGAVTGGELGAKNAGARNAISRNGARVVWSENGIYLRDMNRRETLRLDVAQGGSGQELLPEREFQLANSDDSRVFFTDTDRLTGDSDAATNRPDLYECEIVESAGKLACVLTDLTPGSSGRSADVKGALLGASEDGSYLYFVAGGVLGAGANARGEKAVQGADNLYMLHYDAGSAHWEAPQLIAVLSAEDQPDWSDELAHQTARVAPNGRYLTFMSNRPLTGYNNHDASSGKPDEEVFLFDAGAQRLVCASCDPTGSLPQGVEDNPSGLGRLVEAQRIWPSTAWLAANIPGWTEFELSGANYQSRYLSNEGRLFFNSSDALVPQDVNGTEDVYEYEPAGLGSCTTASPTYGQRTGGCVSLISSGTSAAESAFVDASENGDDAFFITAEKLLPEDIDTDNDIYDAHACSEQAPCFDIAVSSPPCETADACRAAPEPQPAAFGAPASSTFAGAGNVTPSTPAATTVRAKVATKAARLDRALAACRKRYASRKGKRTTCERRSRKRYGVQRSHAVHTTKKRGGR